MGGWCDALQKVFSLFDIEKKVDFVGKILNGEIWPFLKSFLFGFYCSAERVLMLIKTDRKNFEFWQDHTNLTKN